jgi:hypothetical protein
MLLAACARNSTLAVVTPCQLELATAVGVYRFVSQVTHHVVRKREQSFVIYKLRVTFVEYTAVLSRPAEVVSMQSSGEQLS